MSEFERILDNDWGGLEGMNIVASFPGGRGKIYGVTGGEGPAEGTVDGNNLL